MNKAIILAIISIFAVMYAIQSFQTEQPRLTAWDENTMMAFKAWKQKHNKNYGDVDYDVYRFQVFAANSKMIQHHNALDKSYTMGENLFMDLTQEEFKQMFLGLKQQQPANTQFIPAGEVNDVDWRSKGAVTGVKDQGQCGSCWAFSTTGCLEGVTFLDTGKLLSYSEQQLVDCSGSYGNMGCNGGLMDYAFQYVIDYGIELEAKYPYTARDGSCKYDQSSATKIITGYTDVPSGDCNALSQFLMKQPVSIGVDAETWQFYSGGVFDDCGSQLDHGVTLVGQTADYYMVKNSWGTGWGESGYIRLAPGNTCGLCNTASVGNL